jgi:uncharacterized LabA/DUF88 family protein
MVDGANALSPYLQHGTSSSALSQTQARPTSSPTRAATDVALLIDWENLKLSLRDHFGVSPNIDSLLDAASASGRVVLARAYADWTRSLSSVDAPNLYRAGIEPIYVPGREADGRALKNSADVRMAVDAVDVCGRLPHVQTYVLVTGDGDLIHAVNFLQVGGKQVVVVGVRRSVSDLLASTADSLLFYERDVEPLDTALLPDTPDAAREGYPPMDTAFSWVKEIVAEPNDGRPYPFKRLRNELRLRHGLDSRLWYGLPFRHFMLRAERAGHVHVSTIGGLDFASLGRSAPRLDATSLETTPSAPALTGDAPELRLESLTDEEQRSLVGFLKRLQDRSPYMVRKYIVDNLEYGSVLPRLSRDQLDRLVLTLSENRVLVERRETVTNPLTGDNLRAETLTLNEQLPFVQERLSRADPFALLIPAVQEARQLKGIGYFPLVQSALERRLGSRLSDLGYQRLTTFFEEAEQRGLIRIAHLANGADVVFPPDEELPALAEAPQAASVMEELGPTAVAAVLRIAAAAEDRIGGRPVYLGSLIYAVRNTLPLADGPELSSSQLNRLLKDELRQAGYMRSNPLLLDRDNPTVRAALAEGPIALPKSIHVQPYGNAPAAVPPATAPAAPVAPEPDPAPPAPETLAADLAQGRKEALFAAILSLLRSRAPEEYRFTDLGNELRRQFGFQLKEHPDVATRFGDLIDQFGQDYPIETRKQGTQYYVKLLPHPSTLADSAGISTEATGSLPTRETDADEPSSTDEAETDVDPATIPDAVLATALRELIDVEDEQDGDPINPTIWRKRLRQAIERTGGPRLDPKAMSRLIRSRLLPRHLVEPTGDPPSPGTRLRPYRINRDHPDIIALVGSRNGGSPEEHDPVPDRVRRRPRNR